MTATKSNPEVREDITLIVQIIIVLVGVPLVGIDIGIAMRLFRLVAGW